MNQNLISIITPVYNGEKFITETIYSVQRQSYPNWEMIIVDDGSKDGSAQIIQSFSDQDKRIKFIQQVNAGSAAARNNALRHAEGRYVTFLDADDLWEPDFLKKQLAFIKEKDADVVFASYRRINEHGYEILKPFVVPDKVNYSGLLKTCSISCLTALFDKEKTGEVFFNENLKSMRDDFVFWLSILKKIDYAYGNKEILARYRVFANSTTRKKKRVIIPQFKVYHEIEKLGIVKSLYYLLNWAINGFIKYK